MFSSQKDRRNRREFDRAKRQAAENGEMVCGTIKPDGTPAYFVVPKDTPDELVQERAFEVRNGRPFTQGDRLILGLADHFRTKGLV